MRADVLFTFKVDTCCAARWKTFAIERALACANQRRRARLQLRHALRCTVAVAGTQCRDEHQQNRPQSAILTSRHERTASRVAHASHRRVQSNCVAGSCATARSLPSRSFGAVVLFCRFVDTCGDRNRCKTMVQHDHRAHDVISTTAHSGHMGPAYSCPAHVIYWRSTQGAHLSTHGQHDAHRRMRQSKRRRHLANAFERTGDTWFHTHGHVQHTRLSSQFNQRTRVQTRRVARGARSEHVESATTSSHRHLEMTSSRERCTVASRHWQIRIKRMRISRAPLIAHIWASWSAAVARRRNAQPHTRACADVTRVCD